MILVNGEVRKYRGVGHGPIAAIVAALAWLLRIDSYEERSQVACADAMALSIVVTS